MGVKKSLLCGFFWIAVSLQVGRSGGPTVSANTAKVDCPGFTSRLGHASLSLVACGICLQGCLPRCDIALAAGGVKHQFIHPTPYKFVTIKMKVGRIIALNVLSHCMLTNDAANVKNNTATYSFQDILIVENFFPDIFTICNAFFLQPTKLLCHTFLLSLTSFPLFLILFSAITSESFDAVSASFVYSAQMRQTLYFSGGWSCNDRLFSQELMDGTMFLSLKVEPHHRR